MRKFNLLLVIVFVAGFMLGLLKAQFSQKNNCLPEQMEKSVRQDDNNTNTTKPSLLASPHIMSEMANELLPPQESTDTPSPPIPEDIAEAEMLEQHIQDTIKLMREAGDSEKAIAEQVAEIESSAKLKKVETIIAPEQSVELSAEAITNEFAEGLASSGFSQEEINLHVEAFRQSLQLSRNSDPDY